MKLHRRRFLQKAVGALALSAVPRIARAQSYPDRPIRLIVPFAAGGVSDEIGRLWAAGVNPLLGTVVVENQGGASGAIGGAAVARAAPDGYTLLLGNTSTQVLNPAIMPRAPYDPARDFAAVGIVANAAISIGIHPSVPARSLTELVAHIKANPGKMTYGSAGAGTFNNLAGEMFKQAAGTPDVTHIPYRGGGPLIVDVVSGHIPMMIVDITGQVMELHDAGRIRLLAVFAAQRLMVLPDVAAAAETLPGLIASLFFGVFAPAATPGAVIDRLAKASHDALANDAFKGKLIASGFEPVVDTPAQAQRFVEAERARIIPLVKSLGFKLQ